jgi:hypothetical protein
MGRGMLAAHPDNSAPAHTATKEAFRTNDIFTPLKVRAHASAERAQLDNAEGDELLTHRRRKRSGDRRVTG